MYLEKLNKHKIVLFELGYIYTERCNKVHRKVPTDRLITICGLFYFVHVWYVAEQALTNNA